MGLMDIGEGTVGAAPKRLGTENGTECHGLFVLNLVTVPIVMTYNLTRREECHPISSSGNNYKRGGGHGK